MSDENYYPYWVLQSRESKNDPWITNRFTLAMDKAFTEGYSAVYERDMRHGLARVVRCRIEVEDK